jgi:hypothetical protein
MSPDKVPACKGATVRSEISPYTSENDEAAHTGSNGLLGEILMKTIAILTLVTAMLGGCVVAPWGHGRSDGYYRGDGYYYRGDR